MLFGILVLVLLITEACGSEAEVADSGPFPFEGTTTWKCGGPYNIDGVHFEGNPRVWPTAQPTYVSQYQVILRGTSLSTALRSEGLDAESVRLNAEAVVSDILNRRSDIERDREGLMLVLENASRRMHSAVSGGFVDSSDASLPVFGRRLLDHMIENNINAGQAYPCVMATWMDDHQHCPDPEKYIIPELSNCP